MPFGYGVAISSKKKEKEMYNGFLFTAKNRSKEETNLLTLFDANMKPILCRNFTTSVRVALKDSGYEMDEVKFPLGLLVVTVTQIRVTKKRVLDTIMATATGDIKRDTE